MRIRTGQIPPARMTWGITTSTAGRLIVAVTEKGEIGRIAFLRRRKAKDILMQWQREWPSTAFVKGADLTEFEKKPIVLIGTPFQQAVWAAIAAIPSGQVRSYGEIARQIGKPRAARAVGAACGANPVPYLVPCHRVVGAKGMGGFTGGMGIKKALLKKEEIPLR